MAPDADLSRAAGLLEGGRLPPVRARAGPVLRSLLLLWLLVVLLAAAGSAWYVYRGVSLAWQERVRAQQMDEVERLALLLAARLEQQQKVLLSLARPQLLQRLQEGMDLAQSLNAEVPPDEWFDSLSVALAGGHSLVHVLGGERIALDALESNERALLRRTLEDGRPLMATALSTDGTEWRLLYSAPLRSSADELHGSVVAGVRLSSQALLPPSSVDGTPDSRLMLVASDGRILAHSDPARWLGHVRDEPGLGTPFVQILQQQAPVPVRSTGTIRDGYQYSLVGIPQPQWLLVRVTRLDVPPLWGLAGGGTQALLAVALLAALTTALVLWMARPWRALPVRAAQLLQRSEPQSLPALPRAWGEVAVLWRALHALARQRTVQARRAARSEAQMMTILEQAPVAIVVTRHDRLALLGTQAARMLGYLPQELQGYPVRQLCASDADYRQLMERIRWDLRVYGRFDDEVCLMHKDGSPVWLRMQGKRVATAPSQGAGTVVVWMVRDVTDQYQARSHPAWLNMHDALTQLPNRAALCRRLQSWLDACHPPPDATDAGTCPPDAAGVLLFLDLDHFATINQIAGHDAGDAILRHFARLLETLVRPPGWVARLGGDEFAVLLPDATPRAARLQAEQLCEAVNAWEASYEGQRFWLGVSIGMVVLDAQHTSVAAVLHAADMACYAAKRQGRARVQAHGTDVTSTPAASTGE